MSSSLLLSQVGISNNLHQTCVKNKYPFVHEPLINGNQDFETIFYFNGELIFGDAFPLNRGSCFKTIDSGI